MRNLFVVSSTALFFQNKVTAQNISRNTIFISVNSQRWLTFWPAPQAKILTGAGNFAVVDLNKALYSFICLKKIKKKNKNRQAAGIINLLPVTVNDVHVEDKTIVDFSKQSQQQEMRLL